MAVVGSDPRLVGAFAEEETAAEYRVSGNLRQNYVGFEHLQPIRWDPCYIYIFGRIFSSTKSLI